MRLTAVVACSGAPRLLPSGTKLAACRASSMLYSMLLCRLCALHGTSMQVTPDARVFCTQAVQACTARALASNGRLFSGSDPPKPKAPCIDPLCGFLEPIGYEITQTDPLHTRITNSDAPEIFLRSSRISVCWGLQLDLWCGTQLLSSCALLMSHRRTEASVRPASLKT